MHRRSCLRRVSPLARSQHYYAWPYCVALRLRMGLESGLVSTAWNQITMYWRTRERGSVVLAGDLETPRKDLTGVCGDRRLVPTTSLDT